MRTGITAKVTPDDRSSPQKHLARADGCGTSEIMRQTVL